MLLFKRSQLVILISTKYLLVQLANITEMMYMQSARHKNFQNTSKKNTRKII